LKEITVKMNPLLILATGLGLGMVVSACGGSSSGTQIVPPAHEQPTTLGTADVLAKVKGQSQADDPFSVNDGMVTLKPVDDETSDPVSVNN
jgi:hypothetical protein